MSDAKPLATSSRRHDYDDDNDDDDDVMIMKKMMMMLHQNAPRGATRIRPPRCDA
jgi:hypothetical protein